MIDASGPRLDDVEDTSSFRIVASNTDDLEHALGGHGWGTCDGSHAWVSIQAIRDAARGRVTDDWDERFARMVEFAGSRGWLDPSRSSIRGHVELTSARREDT